MASIGRIAISGVTAIAESSQALANLNFDFSLVKVEAPQEFHELGHSLTQKRREAAEDGMLHMTARRLGAMFESILPQTLELVKCYGLRASEIAKASTQATPKNLGIFSKHAGIDGTSIWAGATSGTAAIQVHLLACLLARMWSGPEATAIWVELINSRKLEIQAEFENNGSIDLRILAASRQIIDRSQLAEWDASARAWLRIADITKELQQKQLLLIIGNMEGYVSSKPSTYENVIKAWVTGLEYMEAILKGTPMLMQSGDECLALLSWHIYPNLYILNPVTKTVEQKDSLVPQSAILTIGLQGHETSQNKGLHWSLPMAHLRYYGDPVQRTSTMTCQGSRLTPIQFNMAFLGCVLGGWGVDGSEVESVIEWIKILTTALRPAASNSKNLVKDSWIYHLGDTAQAFLKSESVNRKIFQQLINLGQNHSAFLGKPAAPFFGLAEAETAMQMTQDIEQKIKILRSQALLARLRWEHAIIRYKADGKYEEYASASLQERQTSKRNISGNSKTTSGHCRWIYFRPPPIFEEPTEYRKTDIFMDAFMGATDKDSQQEIIKDASNEVPLDRNLYEEINSHEEVKSNKGESVEHYFTSQRARYTEAGEDVIKAEEESLITIKKPGKRMRVVWGELSMHPHSVWEAYEPWFGEMKHYDYWIGDEESAAIFIRMDQAQPEGKPRLPFKELKELFIQNEFQPSFLIATLGKAFQSLGKSYVNSLRAFGAMNALYGNSTQSTIDIRILNRPMASFKWVDTLFGNSQDENRTDSHSVLNESGESDEDFEEDNEGAQDFSSTSYFQESMEMTVQDLPPLPSPRQGPSEILWLDLGLKALRTRHMNIEESFSCILMLESSFDVLPSQMQNVMAISSGNSLFIAAVLLSDPIRRTRKHEIQHVIGNIGRSGTALLVPPIEPRMRPSSIESWNLLNFDAWDGIERNSFQNSSLHLWFSGSTQEVDIGFSGAQDKELYILESVVSLYGRDQWIADLDILKASQNQSMIYRHRPLPQIEKLLEEASSQKQTESLLTCSTHHKKGYEYDSLPLEAIDNWSELLEKRTNNSIFLAKGNWQARLAAVVICVTQGRKVCLLSGSVCWTCILATKTSQQDWEEFLAFIF